MARKSVKQIRDEVRSEFVELAWVIRDGIELNWSSWEEWQAIARESLSRVFPESCTGLDSFEDVRRFADCKMLKAWSESSKPVAGNEVK